MQGPCPSSTSLPGPDRIKQEIPSVCLLLPPVKMCACTAAPNATASSGLMDLQPKRMLRRGPRATQWTCVPPEDHAPLAHSKTPKPTRRRTTGEPTPRFWTPRLGRGGGSKGGGRGGAVPLPPTPGDPELLEAPKARKNFLASTDLRQRRQRKFLIGCRPGEKFAQSRKGGGI